MSAKHLLLMSGSIACAKTCDLLSHWVKNGDEVKVVVTDKVFEFVGRATLEGLSGNAVIDNVFQAGAMMEHIHLSRWADDLLLCPATANTINKLAAGIADNAVTAVWVAAQSLGKPMSMVPAMNTAMWSYPATQLSVEKLQQWGVKVMLPADGDLACGEQGPGRMPEIDEILEFVR